MLNNESKSIKTVSIIGANGLMGAQSAGMIASFGNAKVYMLARSIDKANEGIDKAVRSLKTDVIRKNLIPCTYDRDLEKAVNQSDWILETLAENYAVKEEFLKRISNFIKPGAVISTISSGLSIEKLSKILDVKTQKRYFGTHFFNPPYKMTLCELVFHKNSNLELMKSFGRYLEKILLRKVVFVSDSPAFAGNRIGFQLMNEVALLAEKYKLAGGIELMDQIAGRYSGKAMPPFKTLDLVGLDTYAAIINNLYKNTNDSAHETFKLPKFVVDLINKKRLGNKTGEGFYKNIQRSDGTKERLVYNIKTQEYDKLAEINLPFINNIKEEIYLGKYTEAMNILKKAKGWQAELARYLISRYISYSLLLVGTIVDSAQTIDTIMAYGFNWVPPSALVDFMGGTKEMTKMIKKHHLPVPEILTSAKYNNNFYTLNQTLDARSFLRT